ncbi:Elongator subunit elp2 [Coemansia sp. RSA 2704]|nr:Elongator subunit elp2 [Coemansia sp. RSA 2705]KAJ2313435.1 Elongator subunit elp2 [Coemansia sp. RSA 2704]
MATVQPELIAVGSNRTAHALDCSGAEAAYAAGTLVALFRPHEARVHAVLRGHTARVNSVRFAQQGRLLVSGAADGTARVWARDGDAWRAGAVLGGHDAPVVATATHEIEGGAATHEIEGGVATHDIDSAVVTCTAATDGCVRVFAHAGAGDAQLQQTLALGAHTALDVALAPLPGGGLLLAAACTDARVRLFVRRGGAFAAAAELVGHTDWVTAVAAHQVTEATHRAGDAATAHWRAGDVVLATASQDRNVRLWRVWRGAGGDQRTVGVSDGVVAGADAVLAGHDAWVHSVAWAGARVVSASRDGAAMVWGAAGDVWATDAQLGAAGALQGAVFGGGGVLAYGAGALYAWAQRDGAWTAVAAPTGHAGAVRDVSWDARGRHVLSVSADQTARLYARFADGWHEAARPQVHGYDMQCAAFVAPHAYVSGAEEKVVRVFRATRQFAAAARARVGGDASDSDEDELADGASLPALGLSNKAVGAGDACAEDPDDTYAARRVHTDVAALAPAPAPGAVPLEDQLQRHTLWPEADKLYGHPHEIYAVAAGAGLVASTCRATSARHAAVRLHSARTGQPAGVLPAHALTATCVRFSADGAWLLSGSRDRSYALFARREGGDAPYALARRQQAHARIVWDVAWAPGARFFATASRDKTVKLWAPDADAPPVTLAFPDAVTAVDFVPERVGARFVLAAALECGRVFVLAAPDAGAGVPTQWTPREIAPEHAHSAFVHRVRWCPVGSAAAWLLASASADHTLRITAINLSSLSPSA